MRSRARWSRYGGSFDVEAKRRELDELEQRLTHPDVWGDPDKARQIQQRRARLSESVEASESLTELLDDARTFLDLAREGEDVGTDLHESVERLVRRTEELELDALLTGDHDASNAILEVHSGAGGTESQDWAGMLLRMYQRWAERRGFKVDLLDLQPGEEAGIKSATLSIEGANAYGYLRVERGVHRLVRISPFDAQARRHTSFASVDVLPEVEEGGHVEVDEKDIRVDTYRASGAGGQHVNKTESAIRITHHPTGIVVTCQNERSQHRNKDVAMKILRAKLVEVAERQAEEALAQEVGEKKKIEWGSQIRSYVLAPYRMVKDHRTSFEIGDADRVLDGDLDGFIRAALTHQAGESGERVDEVAG
ncbi:MAG: peptide chain release factor 2 [Acidobacteria bacterium]|nr:peptide chain release factor 2 [Acidobacteriota bacterium]NIM60504.1 peptide chain release factor 2 [Acidobacteriota bacterium]NIO59475.1 peptide chain release factor 2 [Acidobacteriota bacterium]NIQ30504.1 peptide chain release factor 2 [Acidobacteriota bacterium]NIQ85452.1 peptide chain release factor 2 [Acidobacteriota bacterium]